MGEFHTRPARNAGESASVGEVGKGIKAFVKFLSSVFSFFFFPFRFCFVSFRFFITSPIAKGRSIYFEQGLAFFFAIHPSIRPDSIFQERRNLD